MAYLSHPVRRIRDDPTEGETVSLLLAFDEGSDPPVDAVERAVSDAGGRVERRLAFSTIEVTVPETAVAALCDLDGLDHVETSDTLGLAVETVQEGDEVGSSDGERDDAATDATVDRPGADREPRT